jgi:hypothetical protein
VISELLAGDENTLRWTQAFAAEDVVKKVVVSADQGIVLINTAFTEDLSWLKLPLFQAGAGTSAWAGSSLPQRPPALGSLPGLGTAPVHRALWFEPALSCAARVGGQPDYGGRIAVGHRHCHFPAGLPNSS